MSDEPWQEETIRKGSALLQVGVGTVEAVVGTTGAVLDPEPCSKVGFGVLAVVGFDDVYQGLSKWQGQGPGGEGFSPLEEAAARLGGSGARKWVRGLKLGAALATPFSASKATAASEVVAASEVTAIARGAAVGREIRVGAQTLEELLPGIADDAYIHLTPASAKSLAHGVAKGNSWVRFGDVKHLTLGQYKAEVVMTDAAANGSEAMRVVVAPRGAPMAPALPGDYNPICKEFRNVDEVVGGTLVDVPAAKPEFLRDQPK